MDPPDAEASLADTPRDAIVVPEAKNLKRKRATSLVSLGSACSFTCVQPAAKAERITPVDLAYSDLAAGRDLSDKIREAFGEDGLGILTVSGVPGVGRLIVGHRRSAARYALPSRVLPGAEDPDS